MRSAATQAILTDAADFVRRSSAATPADVAVMDAILDRTPAEDDKPFDFLSLFIGDDD